MEEMKYLLGDFLDAKKKLENSTIYDIMLKRFDS